MITHLACIMDGNRRWARKRGLPLFLGHNYGVDAAVKVARHCVKRGIKFLSLFAFSIENLKRSGEEKKHLFGLLAGRGVSKLGALKEEGVRVRFVGDRLLFPPSVIEACEKIERETELADKLRLDILFCYGARQEIVAAVRDIATLVARGEIAPHAVDEQYFANKMWTSGTPPPELIIRTGGRMRLSNFLLFNAAYSELYFSDILWPDICVSDIDVALDHYEGCQRNFGK